MAYVIPAGASGVTISRSPSRRSGFHGSKCTQRASEDQTALTDNTGGSVANATLADGLTATAVTDNSGGATADGTIGAVTAPAAITDSSGGVDPADNTIAAIAEISAVNCYVYYQNIASAGTTGAADQLNLEGLSVPGTMANLVQPSHPRNIVYTVTDSGVEISAFTIAAVGKSPDGTTVTETIAFAGGLVQTGSKIFASLTSVTVSALTESGATAKTLDIGYGAKIGLPLPYGSTGLAAVKIVAAGTTEAASATDTTNNSITFTTAPDGSKDFEVYYTYTGPATTAIKAAIAQLAAKQNVNRTALIALTDAIKELSTVVNKLVTDTSTQNDTDAKIAELVNELRAAAVEKGLIKGSA